MGRSVSPAIRLSRYAERLAVALFTTAIRVAVSPRASKFSKVLTSFSISSLNRVAAPSATIDSAPVTWCKCVAIYLIDFTSPGSAASASRCERASNSECSISVLTHERGPTSKLAFGLEDIIFGSRVLSDQSARVRLQKHHMSKCRSGRAIFSKKANIHNVTV